jgi:hypothetical protein
MAVKGQQHWNEVPAFVTAATLACTAPPRRRQSDEAAVAVAGRQRRQRRRRRRRRRGSHLASSSRQVRERAMTCWPQGVFSQGKGRPKGVI